MPDPTIIADEAWRADAPAVLVSYAFINRWFWAERHLYRYRNWVLDSGAFSAAYSGTPVDLQAYIAFAKEAMAVDPLLVEVYALDVIGDWRASRKNAEAMWAAGVPAIPCFHMGSPWPELLSLAADYPKIAVGDVARATIGVKRAWLAQCFARVWPKRIHGFGMATAATVLKFPFHSVDASNWSFQPAAFGLWKMYGQLPLSSSALRHLDGGLRSQVDWHLKLEREARGRWAMIMFP
jgi:hypothetical protein